MLKFLFKRLLLTIPTFFALMFVTFVAIRLVPGDPVEVRVGERGISPERLAMFRHELGLDQPVWLQFWHYVVQLLHGDFGTSLVTSQKVLTEFGTLFPATLELSFFGMLFAVVLGLPAGAVAAVKRGTWFDQVLMGLSVTGYSMPIFWWGLLLIMFVGERWGWTPVSGRIDLLAEHEAGFAVIDHKSFPGSRDTWEARAVSYGPQLGLYAEAIEAAVGQACDGLYIHMPIVGALLRVARQTEGAA